MGFMDPMRAETVREARGEVLEIGFGTGRNLAHYASGVHSVHGVDPMLTVGMTRVARRIDSAPFPVERFPLSADKSLPFDAGRFDCVVTTWTLCSIPDADAALAKCGGCSNRAAGTFSRTRTGPERSDDTLAGTAQPTLESPH